MAVQKPRKRVYKRRKPVGLGQIVNETREKEIQYLTRKPVHNPNQGYLPTLEEIEILKAEIREANQEEERLYSLERSGHSGSTYRPHDCLTYTLHMPSTGARRGVGID